MGYNILLFEKTKQEYERYAGTNYDALQIAVATMSHVLSSRGHRVSSIFDLQSLTDQLYSTQNVVIAHPTLDKFQRIKQLHRVFPDVGLIITTGVGKDEMVCHELAQLEDGLLFLEKPYDVPTLMGAVDLAVRQASIRR